MKKSVLLTFLAGVLVLSFGCTKDDDLVQKYNSLEKRVATLEEQVKYLNETTIPSLQNVISAIRSGKDLPFVYIKDIAQLAEGGYSITFSNGTTAVIKDGAQGPAGPEGPEGPEGPSPEMGVTEIEGVFYWTANGELIKDKEGNPVPVHAALPTLRIKDGKWQVSYDNGETWADVPQMGQGGSAIEIIDKETEVIFIINGESHSIKKELPFFLVFDKRTDIGVPQGETYLFEYNIQGITETDQVEVDILSCTAGWEAEVVSVATADAPGYISIKNVDNSNGKIFIYAANGKGKTDIKSLQFEGGQLEVVADVQPVLAAGGEVSFSVTTNMDYDVNVDEDQDWLTLAVDTKATHTDVIKLNAAENTTGSFRSANVYVVNPQTGETVETITVLQYPCETVTTDIASLANVADGTPVKIFGVAVMATSKSSAVVSDGTTLLYTIGKSIPAGKEVTLTGVKTSAGGVPVLEGTTFDITSESTSIKAPQFDYVGAAVNSIPSRTLTAGTLEKEEDSYFILTPMGDKIVFEAPTDDMALDSRLGKTIGVKGYVTSAVEKGTYSVVLESVKNLTVAAQSNWTMSYSFDSSEEYPEIITNTVSGSTSNYMLSVYDAAEVEEEYGITTADEMGIFAATMVPDDLQYYMYLYGPIFGYEPSEIYDIFTYSGSASEGFSELEAGKTYYAVAAGVDADGNATGEYSVLEFEKKDPYVYAEYGDFLGKWANDTKMVEIVKNVEGASYILKGFANGVNGDVTDVAATYNSETGKMVICDQALGKWENATYGSITDFLVGTFEYNGTTYPTYPENVKEYGKPFANVCMNEDGSLSFAGTQIDLGDEILKTNGYRLRWIIDAGTYAGKGNTYASSEFPTGLVKAEEPTEAYKKWLGNWNVGTARMGINGETIDDFIVTISENVPNKSYYLDGLTSNGLPMIFDAETGNINYSFMPFNETSSYTAYCSGITDQNYVANAGGVVGNVLATFEYGTNEGTAAITCTEYSSGSLALLGMMGKTSTGWTYFSDCYYIDTPKEAITKVNQSACKVISISTGLSKEVEVCKADSPSSKKIIRKAITPADKKNIKVK